MLRTINRVPRNLDELYRDMDTVVQHLFGDDRVPVGFTPRTNVAESESQFEISMELPGLTTDDVQLEVEDGCLVVSGEHKNETEAEGKTYHRVERRYGTFRRVVRIPDNVDQERIDANFQNGILTVTLPKSQEEKTRKITIKTS